MRRKALYLTFDDGPDERYTPRLLQLLTRYEIKATFFVLAEAAARSSGLIAQMCAEGHSVQLHANRHISAYLKSKRGFRSEMDAAVYTLRQLGVVPTYYRPPWGHEKRYSAAIAADYGMRLVRWDVMAQDWRAGITAEQIAKRLLHRVRPGAVICLHDGRGRKEAPERMIASLERVLPIWLEQGYGFEVFR